METCLFDKLLLISEWRLPKCCRLLSLKFRKHPQSISAASLPVCSAAQLRCAALAAKASQKLLDAELCSSATPILPWIHLRRLGDCDHNSCQANGLQIERSLPCHETASLRQAHFGAFHGSQGSEQVNAHKSAHSGFHSLLQTEGLRQKRGNVQSHLHNKEENIF